MTKFLDNVYLETEECCNCGITFAVTQNFQKARRNDHKSFYCPAGHSQYYSGKSEAEKLKERLRKSQQEAQQQQQKAIQATSERDASNRRYGRIRDRVKNGVCPCCNRQFQNLASHMKTKHPDFVGSKNLKVLRVAYGLTQVELAKEIGFGIRAPTISLYENKKPVSEWLRNKIEAWIDDQ